MPVWKPSVTVAAVIERDKKFLFVEEKFHGRLVLNQPAGHLDPDESLEHAVVREVMEETAHDFVPKQLVGVYRWFYKPKDVTYLRFCFAGVPGRHYKERKLDKEIVGLHWLSLEELIERKKEHRSPLVQKCVEDYLRGGRWPLEVLSREFA